jgi:hypothetical protein
MKPKLFLCLALGLGVLLALHHYNLFPFHVRARATSAIAPCLNNLREIDSVVNQWALEHGKHKGDPVTLDEIKPYVIKLDRHGQFPLCPDGGTYGVTVVGVVPTCSLGKDSIMRRVHNYFFGEDSINKESRYHRLP